MHASLYAKWFAPLRALAADPVQMYRVIVRFFRNAAADQRPIGLRLIAEPVKNFLPFGLAKDAHKGAGRAQAGGVFAGTGKKRQ